MNLQCVYRIMCILTRGIHLVLGQGILYRFLPVPNLYQAKLFFFFA